VKASKQPPITVILTMSSVALHAILLIIMAFIEKYKVLISVLHLEKRYSAARFLKECPNSFQTMVGACRLCTNCWRRSIKLAKLPENMEVVCVNSHW